MVQGLLKPKSRRARAAEVARFPAAALEALHSDDDEELEQRKKELTMIPREYADWLTGLSRRFRQSQIKAATAVNVEMLKFYWSLGADIVRFEKDQPWGSKFMQRVVAEKIKRLYKAAEANGFVSYAEA